MEQKIHNVLGYQLAQARILTDAAFEAEVGQPLQLRRVEYTVLQIVKENTGLAPTRVSKMLSISMPAMTAWIDKLEHRELIVRRKSKTDGRAQHLELMPKGLQLVNEASQKLLAYDSRMMRHMSEQEQKLLLELLGKFVAGRHL